MNEYITGVSYDKYIYLYVNISRIGSSFMEPLTDDTRYNVDHLTSVMYNRDECKQ